MHKEENEAMSLTNNSTESQKLQEETSSTESEQDQLLIEEQQLLIARFKMIFLALLEGASRYREGYWREEVEAYTKRQMLGLEIIAKTTTDKGHIKRGTKKIQAMSIDFELKMKKFNELMEKEIEDTHKSFSPKTKIAFDNYATGFGILIESYLNARNTTELLTVCQMYNAGSFDATFENLKKAQLEKEESIQNRPGPQEVGEQRDTFLPITAPPADSVLVEGKFQDGTIKDVMFWTSEGFEANEIGNPLVGWRYIDAHAPNPEKVNVPKQEEAPLRKVD